MGFVLAAMTASCAAEIVQLVPMDIKVEADSIKERTPAELSQVEGAKRFIIDFIAKWAPERKFNATTTRYRALLKSPERLKTLFDKESYDRLEFLRFRLTPGQASEAGGAQATVKVNVHWFLEGNDGVTTYYFFLTQERGAWLLDGLIR